MTTALRLGVVGCGAVAEHYHLPAIIATPGVRLVACVDTDNVRAAGLARHTGAAAYSNLGDLRPHVDAAIVTVPNADHAAVTIALLEAGIHVLVEKPMARSSEECHQMIAAAARSGATLAVGHDFRQFPVARCARALFQDELLGAVRRVDVRQSAGSRWPARTTSALTTSAGGGALLTFGVHLLDLLLWWLGDLQPVAYADDAAGGVEAECVADFVLPATGAPISLTVSRRRPLRDTTIVECDRGTLEIGIHEPAVLRLQPRSGSLAIAGTVEEAAFARAPLRAAFERQLQDFTDAVRHHRPPLVTGADGQRVVALIEACYARWQPLQLPWEGRAG
jgi:predicted dehydrogenase